MRPSLTSLILAAPLIPAMLCTAPAQAKELGAVASVRDAAGVVEVRTRDGDLVTIEPYSDTVIRVRVGLGGKLTGSGDKAAPIVIAQSGKPRYTLTETPEYHLLKTDKVSLRIYRAPLRLEAYDAANQVLIWREKGPITLDDKTATQTLSAGPKEQFFGGGQQNGSYAFRGKLMEISYSGGWEEGDRPSPAPFYISSAGYGVLRNTWTKGDYDFRSDDYLTARHAEGRFDAFYIFGGGLHQVVDGYTWLTGRQSMLPRWGYEYGDADCYNDGDNKKKPGTVPKGWSDGPTGTTPDVIQSVAAKYRENDMPGGWILPNDGYGCKYVQLPETVAGLAKYGFKTGLWTENGVDKIAWEVGTAGTRVQKLDVAWTGKGFQFALDANQAAAKGILDNSDSRPVVWTVMGWAGIQRYAIAWTGDQSGSWDYIRWHIPTYIGSSLSGMAYAASDVDGIFGGSPETFTRDLQWKVFTPALMGMSGWAAAERKHPWAFDEPNRSINRRYLKLRSRLMPYLYTYAHDTEQTGAPIVRGLMWDHPQDPNALTEKYKYQFFYGRDFLVAPVYRSQASTQGWREKVYLPQGRWVDYWDGRVIEAGPAGREVDYPVTLDKLPVLVRAGAIVPMYPEALYDGQVRKTLVTFDIYPAGKNSFELYEDDGNTRQYKTGAASRQLIAVDAPDTGAGPITVKIAAVNGRYAGQEPTRSYELLVHSRYPAARVTVDGAALTEARDPASRGKPGTYYYDAADRFGTLHLTTASTAIGRPIEVKIDPAPGAKPAETPFYAAMPPREDVVPADEIKILQRPPEEGAYKLEKALDGDPKSWFRSSRDEAMAYGPHEFALFLSTRKEIDGFDIAPRSDKNWKQGQVKDWELYVSDENGNWGAPARTGTLALQETMQKVRFAPVVGRLVKFRILNVHDAEGGTDPMVTASKGAVNSLAPKKVGNVVISEFRLHERTVAEDKLTTRPLADLLPKTARTKRASEADPLRMNGLAFGRGFATTGAATIDIPLGGTWRSFRADVGVNDGCRTSSPVRFQVYGDGKLLFDSGLITPPAVVKPEIDIRSIKVLRLVTEGGGSGVCANWANATLTGEAK